MEGGVGKEEKEIGLEVRKDAIMILLVDMSSRRRILVSRSPPK